MASLPPPTGAAWQLDDADALEVLARGELEVRARLVDASNATLLAQVSLEGVEALCVYKPTAGERPLWDFPNRTLAKREVATYVLSAATGWGIVPPTTLRADGPFGPGSVQWWIHGDPAEEPDDEESGLPLAAPGAGLVDVVPPGRQPKGWLHVVEAMGWDGERVALVHADDPALRRMAVLDAVVNNADRKGGHILRGADGRLRGVDHGLTFNEEDKLRTVLWGWGGQPLPREALEVLARLESDLGSERNGGGELRRGLLDLLEPHEVRRTLARVRTLTRTARHPRPGGGRPSIPWPAF